jgi:hypothetical protein
MKNKAVSGIMLTLLLTSTLTLALSIELVSAIIPPEPEYPAIYVDPPIVENIMPPNNFTVAIKTNYDGTDITSWQFTLSYNPSVLHGGLRDTDTWTGDGVTKKFYITKKPLVLGEDVRVYINYIRVPPMNYTVDYSEGIIEFRDCCPPPADGAEVMAIYRYGHYTVDCSEGKINFLTLAVPANGAKVEATYTYEEYSVDYAEGKIKFFVPPDGGTKVEVTYLYSGVTNGDLIALDMPRAAFTAGTFNNTLGRLSVTMAFFFPLPPPIPVTSGPGTLATIAFTVVGEGTSDITLERAALVGIHDGDTYCIVDDTMPAHIGHGYFDNTAPPPAISAAIDIHPHTLNLKSKGKWIACFIELPKGYDANDIDVSTVMLNETIPISLLDVPAPEPVPTEIGDYDNDTVPDSMVKFDIAMVSELILSRDIKYGNVTLTITGEINGTPFEGSDSIRVICPCMQGQADVKVKKNKGR